MSQWVLVQLIVDVFCIVRILTLILVFKNAENPKKCEVALYLIQVCGYWTFITYWTWVGAYLVYGNQGLRDCWLSNKDELMPLVRMS